MLASGQNTVANITKLMIRVSKRHWFEVGLLGTE